MRLKYGVCISGTHGKTTTTSMTGLVLKEGGFDPTIVIGGVLDSVGSNTLLGKGDYFVVEACEAFGSFLQLSPAICVVTNIDNDHLDHYQNMDNLRDAFVRFMNRLPFYGFALVCGDDLEITRVLPRVVRRTVTYGFKEGNDLRAVVETSAGLTTSFSLYKGASKLGTATLKMPGRHNVLNAVAAIGVGMELGMDFAACARGLEQFTGVRRRFQVKGEAQGVTVVDDYAHHPTELDATLKAARDALKGQDGRLVVAFQPHLFSRTQLLYGDFARVLEQADEVYLCGIYPARETPIPGVTSQLIVDLLEAKGKSVTYCFDQNDLLPKALKSLRPGDLFVTAGAGTIDQLGDKVLASLKSRAAAA
jgi:UDP-N-acetylmuramate--alanine ligase